ncbi:MAG: hypothetical protein DRN12_07930 [Thermoplasmata archaeon]|nr:MAG: hypothetical protein DRN12_07930 [Thermoplasmata archaeon]
MKLISLIALVLVCALMLNPILALAQQRAEIEEAKAAAEADAKANTNTALWFAAGCLGGYVGLHIAYIYQPSPFASRLLGKSPEYVAVYTDAYRNAVKEIQVKWAWTGYLTRAGVLVAYIALAVIASLSAATE